MPRAAAPWNVLFAHSEGDSAAIAREFQVIYKSGHPLLALPGSKQGALASLSLYPAQTVRARLARRLLSLLLKSGLRIGMKPARLEIARQAPFTKFLSDTVGEAGEEPPEFGILAGNPRSPGQRFLILVCARNGQPSAVIKAGISQEAKSLILKESTFLKEMGGKAPGIPALRKQFEDSRVGALALDYFPGGSPSETCSVEMTRLLGQWIDTTRSMPIEESGMWRQLKSSPSAKAKMAWIESKLAGKRVHPVISHGDFAPWNIRVLPSKEWMALDWERGDPRGLPGWDWFHFMIQPAILVRKAGIEELVRLVEAMLASDAFKTYAQKALIQGCERELLAAYLVHIVEVIQPSEGLEQNRVLLNRVNVG